jgi:hypothetical protein
MVYQFVEEQFVFQDSQSPIEKTVDTADDSEKSKPSHPDVVDVTDQFLQEKDGVKTQTQQKLEQQEPVVQQQQSGIPLVVAPLGYLEEVIDLVQFGL